MPDAKKIPAVVTGTSGAITKNVFGVCAMCDNGFFVAFSLVDGDSGEPQVSAGLADISLDGQDVSQLRSRHVRDVDIGAESGFFKPRACNGHATRPVHNGGRNRSMKGPFRVEKVGMDLQGGHHRAVGGTHKHNVGEEEAVDWRILRDTFPT